MSLVTHQISILRERNMTMRRRMNDLLSAARTNDELFAKTRSLTLALLDAHTWHELNEELATHMLVDFEADFVCCHLSANSDAARNMPNLDHLRHHQEVLPLAQLSGAATPQCVTLRADEMARLFPNATHDDTGSAVLLPFTTHGSASSLCVGSRNAQHFATDMDTLFMSYITDVVAKIVARLCKP